MNTFQTLGLNEELLRAIADLGFETPSEVQDKAIPVLLEKDTDMVALAQTGTGKTAAFGFPLIQKINSKDRSTQALILSPTRELCLQITNEIKHYSKYVEGLNTVAVYGGASITEQAKQLKRGAQIIVATPGRMLDMIKRRYVDITAIQYCVLDEADEMLNMGFYEDITSILEDTPENKTTWLFSATMPKEVAQIAKEFMSSPYEITVGHKNEGTKNVSHEYYTVGARDRYPVLKRLADLHPEIFSVVFCRTKRDTQSVAEKLIEDGYNAAALHGDLSQAQRDGVMKAFRGRQIQMLVATDVAARGIDVDDITHVINYQLPDEVETYTHRSGRTGRAGKTGTSIVIITKSERRKIAQIERIMKTKFEEKSIPTGEEICEVQLFHLVNKVKAVEVDTEIEKYLPKIEQELNDLSKEELIRRMFSIEFNRFIAYYKKQNILKAPTKGEASNYDDGDSVRFFLNLGARDDFDWMSLKDFLKATLDLGRDDVYKVDVKEGFSFFNTDEKHSEKVMSILNSIQHEGRRVNVEISSSSPKGSRSRGGGGSGHRKKSRGRDDRPQSNQKFGRRRNDDRPLKNERSSTRGNRPRRSK